MPVLAVIIIFLIIIFYKLKADNSVRLELSDYIKRLISSFPIYTKAENINNFTSLPDYFIGFSKKRYPENTANISEHKKHLKQRAFEHFIYGNETISKNLDLILLVVICLWIEDSPILSNKKYKNYSTLDYDIRTEINKIKECPFFNSSEANASVIPDILDCLNLIYNEFLSMREINHSEHIAGTSELLLCLSAFINTFPKDSNPSNVELFSDFISYLYEYDDESESKELHFRAKAVLKAWAGINAPFIYTIPFLILSCFWIEKRGFLSPPEYSSIPAILNDITDALNNTYYSLPSGLSLDPRPVAETLSFYDLTYEMFYSELSKY